MFKKIKSAFFGRIRFVENLTTLVNALTIDDALLRSSLNAVCISAETSQSGVHDAVGVLSGSHDVVELFVLDFQPTCNRAVNYGLELGTDGIEIDRRGEHNHVRVYHLLEQLGHVIFD